MSDKAPPPAAKPSSPGPTDASASARRAPSSADAPAQAPDDRGASAPAAPGDEPPSLSELLDQYRKELEEGQKEVARLEPMKAALADKAQRVQAIAKALEGQRKAQAAYTDLYRAVELFTNESRSFIDTVREQVQISDPQKKRAADAVAGADGKIQDARAARDEARDALRQQESDAAKIAAAAAAAKQRSEFLASGLQQRTARARDALKTLRQQAASATDPSEVWFHLSEMGALLASANVGDADAGWADDLTLGTFLDRWKPDAYAAAQERWYAEQNAAESADRQAKADLADARKGLAGLEKAAGDAEAKRRDAILAVLKAAAANDAAA
jgi:DNA repair exonuclease SbcCD ATPase subunit